MRTLRGSPSAQVADRRQRRHEATKAEILRAAWELAERDGIGALTLSDLTGQLDMAPQSLYGYFASKHDVYDAMFREANEALRTHISRAADEDTPSRPTGPAAPPQRSVTGRERTTP